MNLRKPIDHSAIFMALDRLAAAEQPQMKLRPIKETPSTLRAKRVILTENPTRQEDLMKQSDLRAQLRPAVISVEGIDGPAFPLNRRRLAECTIDCMGKQICQLTCIDFPFTC